MSDARLFAGTAAAAEPVPGLGTTWRDLLFDGDTLRDPDEPSQALLDVTGTLHDGLRAHLATIPERARRHWLEETLGIPPLPMLPDEVVAVATAEPSPAPAVLAAGTGLRAKKAGGVPERTYVTTDTLTVLGAAFAGVHGYLADGPADTAAFSPALAAPFAPFAGTAAEHRIDLVTDAIAFAGGSATVTVKLTGATASLLRDARWEYSTADGLLPVAALVSGDVVTLTLADGCAPYDLDGEKRTYLRVTIPGDRMTDPAYGLAFHAVEVTVVREGLKPDGAFYNDGALDATKEFKPFGPVPRRGDSFYLRSDEAFSKPLADVRITVDLMTGQAPVAFVVVPAQTVVVAAPAPAPATSATPAAPAQPPPEQPVSQEDFVAPVVAAILGAATASRVGGLYVTALQATLAPFVRTGVGTVIGSGASRPFARERVNAISTAVMVAVGPPVTLAATAPAFPAAAPLAIVVANVAVAVRTAVLAVIGPAPAAPAAAGAPPAATVVTPSVPVTTAAPGGITISAPGAPVLQWEHLTPQGWTHLAGTGTHMSARGTPGSDPASAPTEVAGTPGHFLRLHLVRGDFGWDHYLARIARFAAQAASTGGADPSPSDLIPPEPPIVASVRIGYTTTPQPVLDIRTRNEPSADRLPQAGSRRPFRQLVSDPRGPAGAIVLGFTVGAAHLGSTLSWYADVAQATACGSAGRTHVTFWEYWSTGGAWYPLDTLDGTRGLRQSGLVRLVTPKDWAEGCPDVGAAAGRWLRLRTTTPDFVGDLLGVHADAVTARYRPDADVAGDLAPLTPLVPKQLKGLRVPVAGVKVTNPAPGTPGRAAEDEAAFRARAGSVVRHRNRGVQAWDYETLVTTEFPEVAVVRCLPHAGADGCDERGSVGLVVLPRSTDAMPFPSVALAERIAARLRPRMPVHARAVVLCPEYVPIRFRAAVVLRRGVAAAEARVRILAAVERRLHPLRGVEGAPFGLALYPSSQLAFLEDLADVDHVTSFGLLAPTTTGDVVPVDACRGLIASGGDHELDLEEQL